MVKKTIPKAPTHCISERQKRMPWGRHSTSAKTVAPVVVKPDVDSKKASVTSGKQPCMRKGNMPKSEKITQTLVTRRKAS